MTEEQINEFMQKVLREFKRTTGADEQSKTDGEPSMETKGPSNLRRRTDERRRAAEGRPALPEAELNLQSACPPKSFKRRPSRRCPHRQSRPFVRRDVGLPIVGRVRTVDVERGRR